MSVTPDKILPLVIKKFNMLIPKNDSFPQLQRPKILWPSKNICHNPRHTKQKQGLGGNYYGPSTRTEKVKAQ